MAESDKRTTLFPRSEINTTLSADSIKPSSQTARTLQKRKFIPERGDATQRFPVKPMATATLSTQPPFIVTSKGSPWVKYQRILQENQGGCSDIAYKKDPAFLIVAIKTYAGTDSTKIHDIIRARHQNIVSILDAFYDNNTAYIVQEYMAVSIAEIQASPLGKFEEYEIAAICKEASMKFLNYSLHTNKYIGY
jgi:hypothetical protein